MVKGYVAKHNQKFTLKEEEALVLSTLLLQLCEKVEDSTGKEWTCCGRNFDQCWQWWIEELEPDDSNLQCLWSESVSLPISPAGEKPYCSRQFQLEHTGSLSPVLCLGFPSSRLLCLSFLIVNRCHHTPMLEGGCPNMEHCCYMVLTWTTSSIS